MAVGKRAKPRPTASDRGDRARRDGDQKRRLVVTPMVRGRSVMPCQM